MVRDYYLILGVPRVETGGGIQAAFRALAKRYHPDLAGQAGAQRFREVMEAYEVLSDPVRRRGYDEQLQTTRDPLTRPAPEPAWTPSSDLEPLVPEPVSIADDYGALHPSRDDLLRRVQSNFRADGPKGERTEPLRVTLAVPPETALRGGTIAIGVPVFRRCRYCRGTGRDWISTCPYCQGEGSLLGQEPVRVQVPPFYANGMTLDIPLLNLGIRNLYLRLDLRVSE